MGWRVAVLGSAGLALVVAATLAAADSAGDVDATKSGERCAASESGLPKIEQIQVGRGGTGDSQSIDLVTFCKSDLYGPG